jgi:hypothetical protein
MLFFSLTVICHTEDRREMSGAEINKTVKLVHDENEMKQRFLLYYINHDVLAAEARKLATAVRWGKSQPETKENYFSGDDLVRLPPGIVILKPSSVRVFNDRVEMEFGGALYYYEISIFRNGEAGHGTKQLAPNVWFTSQDNKVPEPLRFDR